MNQDSIALQFRTEPQNSFTFPTFQLLLKGAGLPMMIELVQKSEKYINQGHFGVEGKPETLTRQFLIEPLLRLLGWSDDPAGRFYYVREFRGGMDRKWEDYVLLSEDRPLVFVETKPLFDEKLLSTRNVNELLNYMKEFNRKNRNGHRLDWGLLTNFREIHIFYVSRNKPFFSCDYNNYVEKINLLKELISVDGIARAHARILFLPLFTRTTFSFQDIS